LAHQQPGLTSRWPRRQLVAGDNFSFAVGEMAGMRAILLTDIVRFGKNSAPSLAK
jgi:hypothetical protein